MSEEREIYRDDFDWIVIKDPSNGGKIKSQSVEANLLYEVLRELRNLNYVIQEDTVARRNQ